MLYLPVLKGIPFSWRTHIVSNKFKLLIYFSYFGDLGSVVRLDSMWEASIPLMWVGPAFILVLAEAAKCNYLHWTWGLDPNKKRWLRCGGKPLPAPERGLALTASSEWRVNMDTKPGSHLCVIWGPTDTRKFSVLLVLYYWWQKKKKTVSADGKMKL